MDTCSSARRVEIIGLSLSALLHIDRTCGVTMLLMCSLSSTNAVLLWVCLLRVSI